MRVRALLEPYLAWHLAGPRRILLVGDDPPSFEVGEKVSKQQADLLGTGGGGLTICLVVCSIWRLSRVKVRLR